MNETDRAFPNAAGLPPVTLIVLNWNGRALLHACLTAVETLDYPDRRIILADNASTDDSVAFVQAHFPGVDILPTGGNLGYAGGNNAALRQVTTPLAVLLNPDVIVPPDWLHTMVTAVGADPRIAIAGCKLIFPDGTLQHSGGFVSPPRALPAQRTLGADLQGVHDVDYVTGAALLVRQTFWQTAGLLDDGFFMYFEEVDWCARARQAGRRVVVVSDATAVHDESALSGRGSAALMRRFHTGRWRYLLKHAPAGLLFEQTVAAEKQWLAEIGPLEREAAADAYRQTLAELPAVLAARLRDGGSDLRLREPELRRDLAALGELALLGAEPDWPRLEQALRVTEVPFTSPLPLVARLRSAWANVATRWHVRPLVQQQNAANQALLAELQAAERGLREQAAVVLAIEAGSAGLAAQQAALRAELAELERLVTAVEERIARLEQQLPSS